MEVTWSVFKGFVDDRRLSIQWVDINDTYYMKAFDHPFELECKLYKNGPDQADKDDFELNYKDLGNHSPKSEVRTQFERDDLTIKMAKIKETVVDGECRVELRVPGILGSGDGRYLAGGYGMLDTHDPDDHMICTVEDIDRAIAWQIALAIDPQAEAPVSDATVQGMGDYPNYPIVGSYTEDEGDPENEGWYFWPLAKAGGNAPIGEIELEPLGYYGFVPAGFYLVFTIVRPNVSNGTIRGDIIWGKRET